MSDALDSLVDEVVEAAPPVSPIATREIEAEGAEETATATDGQTPPPVAPPEGLQQNTSTSRVVNVPVASSPFGVSNGEQFDPEIHDVDADGKPFLNRDGKFARKRGRKKGSHNGGAGHVNTTVLDADNVRLQKAATSARAVVQSLFVMGALIGGEEWQPIVDPATNRDEPAMLTQAYTEWFLTMENIEVPPWLGVAIVTAAYVIPRMALPKTASRISAIWGWLSGWFSSAKQGD